MGQYYITVHVLLLAPIVALAGIGAFLLVAEWYSS